MQKGVMFLSLKNDALRIIDSAITAALPDTVVKKHFRIWKLSGGRLILISIGKAAWSVAKAASDILGDKLDDGIVITKYDHSMGHLPNIRIYEAGHPIPDDNSFAATEQVINIVSGLSPEDQVLFLISGGGSALFEKPLVSKETLEDVTKQLLASGADIVEINTIRKRLSAVKGGKFANCANQPRCFQSYYLI